MCSSVQIISTIHEKNSATTAQKSMSSRGTISTSMSTSSLTSSLSSFLLVAILSASSLIFSLWLPFGIPLFGISSSAKLTYVPARYEYDDVYTRFDNTIWTYGTDYGLAVFMTILSVLCNRYAGRGETTSSSRKLSSYSSGLLLCYAISTLFGGYSHMTYGRDDVSELNARGFRFSWTITVGFVSFASAFMGLIGREVQIVYGMRDALPLGPWWFWPAYGTYMTIACGLGYMSYKRPACDIFVAGITQFPTTAYCLLALGMRRWPSLSSTSTPSSSSPPSSMTSPPPSSPIELVKLRYRIMYYVGFMGNSPLLPMYPILVQHSGLTLGTINALLHAWLMTMWGMQGISLLHLIRAIDSYETMASKRR